MKKLGVVLGQHPPATFYQFLPDVRFCINVRSLSFPAQMLVPDASMHVFAMFRFLTIVAIVKAVKLDDEPLDIVVGEISSHLYLGQHPPIKVTSF